MSGINPDPGPLKVAPPAMPPSAAWFEPIPRDPEIDHALQEFNDKVVRPAIQRSFEQREDRIATKLLGALIDRLGGEIVLTLDDVETMHENSYSVSAFTDHALGTVTLRSEKHG